MNAWTLSLTAVLLLAAAEGPASAAPAEIPDDVEFQPKVVYGQGGGHDLVLELYRPKAPAAAPRPGVVFMHGGGWRGGTPGQFRFHSVKLAQKGYVCASIRYRYSGEAPFPAAVEDSKCAVRWMRAHAAELGVDPERIAAAGGSAGGHLAGMVAYSDGFEGSGGWADQSSKVACYVGFNPVVSCLQMAAEAPHSTMLIAFLGGTLEEKPDAYRDASLETHAGAGDPPTLLFFGENDHTVPIAQPQALVEQLAAEGAVARLDLFEGVGHAFFNKDPWLTDCYERMAAFLDEHLAK